MLLLHEFEFDIHHQRRVQHAVADYLSWHESGEPTQTMFDNLPNTDIFGINLDTEHAESSDGWIDDMIHFLSTRLRLEQLPLDAKKGLAVRSRNFCLVDDTICYPWDKRDNM